MNDHEQTLLKYSQALEAQDFTMIEQIWQQAAHDPQLAADLLALDAVHARQTQPITARLHRYGRPLLRVAALVVLLGLTVLLVQSTTTRNNHTSTAQVIVDSRPQPLQRDNAAQLIPVATHHDTVYRDATYSADGQYIIAAHYTGLDVHNASTPYNLVNTVAIDTLPLAVIALPDNRVLVRMVGYQMGVWDILTGENIWLSRTGFDYEQFDTITLSGDGQTIATFSQDRKAVKFWDANTGREQANYYVPSAYGQRNAIALSHDGSMFAISGIEENDLGRIPVNIWSAYSDDRLRTGILIFDTSDGLRIGHLTGVDNAVSTILFHPTRNLLVSVLATENEINVWDVTAFLEPGNDLLAQEPLFTITTSTGGVPNTALSRDIQFSPDGNALWLMASTQNFETTLVRFDVDTFDVLSNDILQTEDTLFSTLDSFSDMMMHPTQEKVLTRGQAIGTPISEIDVTGQQMVVLASDGQVRAVDVNHDGTLAAFLYIDRTSIRNVMTGQESRAHDLTNVLAGRQTPVDLALLPDNRLVMLGYTIDGGIGLVFDPVTNTSHTLTLPPPNEVFLNNPVLAYVMEIAADGNSMTVLTSYEDIYEIPLNDDTQPATLIYEGDHENPLNYFNVFAWDEANNRVAFVFASAPNAVQVYDIESETFTRLPSGGAPQDIVFYDNGRKLAVSDQWSGNLTVWDTITWEELFYVPLAGSNPTITPNGDVILLASHDSTDAAMMRVLDAQTGELLAMYEGHQIGILDIAVSDDNTTIVTTDLGGKTIVWQVEPQ